VESKYCPADLNKNVAGCNLISTDQQEKLHKLLKKFAHLFDGTLGNWKTDPVDLELKDRNEKPYHAKPYPVQHSQEQQLKDEVQQLVDFGVLRKVNRSEWACPMFTISKPDKLLRSLADLRELNKRIKSYKETLCNTKDKLSLAKARSILPCNIIRSKYGILSYRTDSLCL
jgi:hypothetical protein